MTEGRKGRVVVAKVAASGSGRRWNSPSESSSSGAGCRMQDAGCRMRVWVGRWVGVWKGGARQCVCGGSGGGGSGGGGGLGLHGATSMRRIVPTPNFRFAERTQKRQVCTMVAPTSKSRTKALKRAKTTNWKETPPLYKITAKTPACPPKAPFLPQP